MKITLLITIILLHCIIIASAVAKQPGRHSKALEGMNCYCVHIIKASLSASNKWKYTSDQMYHTHVAPIDSSIRTNHKNYCLLNGDIQT